MTQQQTDQQGLVWEIPGHHWQEPERVQEYVTRTTERADERKAWFLQMADLFLFELDAPIRVLDVGSGYGAVAAAVLERFPNATAIGLDISAPMMEVGREKMAQFGDRFRYHIGDFAEGTLPDNLAGRFDAVVSSAAIHHLPSAEKQRLYKSIYERLNSNGCFFNVDAVDPEEEDVAELIRQLRERDRVRRGDPPREPRAPEAVLTHHHFETASNQIAWLRAAGFSAVDCFHKHLRDTIIGGYKRER